jgi:hypothetical protein
MAMLGLFFNRLFSILFSSENFAILTAARPFAKRRPGPLG